jgi:hypothetical protein
MVLSHLSPAEAADIRGEFRKLSATIGELNDWPVVTFERAGMEIGAVACITIRLANQAERATGAGTAATGTEANGTLKVWADAFTRSIRQGDRFVWQDQACAVRTGAIEKNGVVTIEFDLMTGNRGGG